MDFPSDRVRKRTLYWTVTFLTLLITALVVFGSDTNALHRTALESAMTLYAWVVLGVVLSVPLDAAVNSYFKTRQVPHE